MSQPKWRTVSTTDHTRIRKDTTGVYAPEFDYAVCDNDDEDDDRKRRYPVYTIVLERLTLESWVQLDLFAPVPPRRLIDVVDVHGNNHAPWFEDHVHDGIGAHVDGHCKACGMWVSRNLSDAARSANLDPDNLRHMFCSDDVRVRALAYQIIADHHGYENFDSYPDT